MAEMDGDGSGEVSFSEFYRCALPPAPRINIYQYKLGVLV